MKIIFRIFTIIIVFLVTWVMIQNLDYSVDFYFFDKQYTDLRLPLVILGSLVIGFIFGTFLIALVALQYKAEIVKVNKKNKSLMNELYSLRNLSIEDITLEDLNIDEVQPVQIPIVDKSKTKPDEESEKWTFSLVNL